MKTKLIVLAATCLLAVPAFASGSDSDATKQPEATPPTLPSQASARAKYVHENIAFGKKGAAERAAHSEAKEDADAAQAARVAAARQAAEGAAASAAKQANADSHAAAGLARAAAARGSNPSSSHH